MAECSSPTATTTSTATSAWTASRRCCRRRNNRASGGTSAARADRQPAYLTAPHRRYALLPVRLGDLELLDRFFDRRLGGRRLDISESRRRWRLDVGDLPLGEFFVFMLPRSRCSAQSQVFFTGPPQDVTRQ